MAHSQAPNQICLRSLISGRVQGVCYRLYTQEKAVSLGLLGWVRNLSNGSVEAVVQGDRTQVEAMATWFWQGSPASDVESVATEGCDLQPFKAFEIRR